MARLLARCLADRPLAPRPAGTPRHIVVPRWDAKLGDAIVSSFFFREARKLGARVTVLTVAELVELHQADFGVDRVITVSANPGLAELLSLARRLGEVDAVVHLVGRIQPAELLFIRQLRPRLLYALDDDLRCVNRKWGAETAGLGVAERFARVLMDLGADTVDRRYIVPLPRSDDGGSPAQLLLNPYASRPDKSLGHTRTLSLLHALCATWPKLSIGILCSPVTREDAQRLVEDAALPQVGARVELDTPRRVAGAIRQARAVVSVDTAIVHMAVGLGVPLVAIYPASGDEHNPWLPPASPVTRTVFSRQDPRHYARTGRKDMNAFDDDEVITHLASLLDSGSPAAPQPQSSIKHAVSSSQ